MNSSSHTPKLNTTFTKSLYTLEEQLLSQCDDIQKWFDSYWQATLPPVYGSVDLRNAGFKLAPVDMNLFPAGFNNLNPNFLSISITAAKNILQKIAPLARSILVIPESHTRNLPYWSNIKTLQKILEQAGFKVQFGSLAASLNSEQVIQLETGETITIGPLVRTGDELFVGEFKPDVILLNNDLSEGIPDILRDLKQPLLPPAELGWSKRLKSVHFRHYAEVADAFAKQFQFDPWLISPLFKHCGKLDFMQQEGLGCIISHAEVLFKEIQKKYDEYHISQQPFLIVKADSGTYGMAVMTVRNIEELKSLNRKQRTKMASTKGGRPVERVIIQEGIHTFETIAIGDEQAVAEPVIYLWGGTVVGGFYRVHKARGVDENLNAPGMQFEPLAFRQTCHEPSGAMGPGAIQNQYYIYGVVAKLSMLAAAHEIKECKK